MGIDLLLIALVATGLLYVAWTLTGPLARSVPETNVASQPELPELQPQLPIAGQGMVLSKVSTVEDRQQATDILRRSCVEVLQDDRWILPLEVSREEAEQLARCVPESQLTDIDLLRGHAIYRLPEKLGLIGVREGEPGARSEAEEGRHKSVSPDAAIGRRVICWGFVVSDGADRCSVWFVRPSLSLPATSLEGSPR